jgi:ion channel POLLUX/CASTOR
MKRFKAWFDSSLSRRGALAFWAIMAILGLVVTGTLLLVGQSSMPVTDPEVDGLPVGLRVFLTALSRSLGIAPPATLLSGVLTLWFWFVGLLVMGTIFAWRTNALARTTARVLAGRTPITDRGHIVILGWSPIVPVLVREIARATGRRERRTLALLSPVDRRASLEALEDILQGDRSAGRVRLITRSGDPWNPSDLRRVNCGAARTVIIVDDPTKNEYSSITLAFTASAQREDARQLCIVQVRNVEMKAIVDRSTDARYIAVTSEDVILKALAQSARRPGVTEALFELLDFGGSEAYRQRVHGSAGLTYGEVASRLVGASAIGVVQQDGLTLVNPCADTIVSDDEQFILVKRSADQVAVLGPVDPGRATTAHIELAATADPHVGIVGPLGPASTVAHNLRSFLAEDATISIFTHEASLPSDATGRGASIHLHKISDYFNDLAAQLKVVRPDQVVVLAEVALDASPAETDARTAVIVAAARQALEASNPSVRFVAQVLDPASRGVIPIRASDDLIVSEEASAMMIAQAASDPAVFGILADLLDPSVGSAIHVLSLAGEQTQGHRLRYRDLVDIGLRAGVSVIGWCYSHSGTGWTVDVSVDRDAVVPDADGVGVLAIAGSTRHAHARWEATLPDRSVAIDIHEHSDDRRTAAHLTLSASDSRSRRGPREPQ